jgi:hypothetical protein
MEFPNNIICVDMEGKENQFRYNREEVHDEFGRRKWIYRIIPGAIDAIDWFEFSVVKIDDQRGKISDMNTYGDKRYKMKGIPDKMIEEAARTLKLQIISSTNNPAFKVLYTEWRSPDADKVWQRLVSRGIANYDSRTDIFTFLG